MTEKTGKTADPGDFDSWFGDDKPEDVSNVREKLEAIAAADPRLLFNELGDPKEPHDWPDREAQLVTFYNRNKDGVVTIRLADKVKAMDQLARMDGLYKADNDQKDPFQNLLAQVPRADLHEIIKNLRAANRVEQKILAEDDPFGPDSSGLTH